MTEIEKQNMKKVYSVRFPQFVILFEKRIVGVCIFLFTETEVFITLFLILSKNVPS